MKMFKTNLKFVIEFGMFKSIWLSLKRKIEMAKMNISTYRENVSMLCVISPGVKIKTSNIKYDKLRKNTWKPTYLDNIFLI